MSLYSVKGNVVGEGYIAYSKYFNYITIIPLTGQRWIPLTKARDAEHWCLLWSAPQQTLETQVRDWCEVITNGIFKQHLNSVKPIYDNQVIMGPMGLKSAASLLFTQPFIQEQIRENIEAPCPWPFSHRGNTSLLNYSHVTYYKHIQFCTILSNVLYST